MIQRRVEQLLNVILTFAAVIIAVSLVHREFFARSASAGAGQAPTYVSGWQNLADSAVLLGKRDARVVVVEFMDLECPFCRSFHETTKFVRDKYGDRVAIAILDLPLQGHRFARPAARGLDCAGRVGRYEPFLDAVYTFQDSLGLRSWQWFAAMANVTDTARFNECTAQPSTVAAVETGLRLARRIGATGTPTVLVNGWRFPTPPDSAQLDRVIADLLAGRKPSNGS